MLSPDHLMPDCTVPFITGLTAHFLWDGLMILAAMIFGGYFHKWRCSHGHTHTHHDKVEHGTEAHKD